MRPVDDTFNEIRENLLNPFVFIALCFYPRARKQLHFLWRRNHTDAREKLKGETTILLLRQCMLDSADSVGSQTEQSLAHLPHKVLHFGAVYNLTNCLAVSVFLFTNCYDAFPCNVLLQNPLPLRWRNPISRLFCWLKLVCAGCERRSSTHVGLE